MSELHKNNPKAPGNEIDIVELIKKLWKERKFIFWGIGISIIIGLAVAFILPKQYKVITTMLPQSDEGKSLGSLSSLAAIAGFDIDLSDNGSDISPVIFPQIMESETFLLNLMHSKYSFKKVKQPISMYDYYTKVAGRGIGDKIYNYTIGLPAVIKAAMKKKKPIGKASDDGLTHMTEDEYNLSKMLSSNVTLSINKKEGYLTLTSIFEEDILTAQVAKRAQQILQETITTYKTTRANDQLNFFEKRYNEKRIEYQQAQARLADFKDRNLFVTSAVGGSQVTRLQNEYNLAYSVFSELAKQYENAKIKVKRVTPVYIILKPVVVPNEPFAPKKTIILLVFMMLGGVISSGIVLGRDFFRKRAQKQEA